MCIHVQCDKERKLDQCNLHLNFLNMILKSAENVLFLKLENVEVNKNPPRNLERETIIEHFLRILLRPVRRFYGAYLFSNL